MIEKKNFIGYAKGIEFSSVSPGVLTDAYNVKFELGNIYPRDGRVIIDMVNSLTLPEERPLRLARIRDDLYFLYTTLNKFYIFNPLAISKRTTARDFVSQINQVLTELRVEGNRLPVNLITMADGTDIPAEVEDYNSLLFLNATRRILAQGNIGRFFMHEGRRVVSVDLDGEENWVTSELIALYAPKQLVEFYTGWAGDYSSGVPNTEVAAFDNDNTYADRDNNFYVVVNNDGVADAYKIPFSQWSTYRSTNFSGFANRNHTLYIPHINSDSIPMKKLEFSEPTEGFVCGHTYNQNAIKAALDEGYSWSLVSGDYFVIKMYWGSGTDYMVFEGKQWLIQFLRGGSLVTESFFKLLPRNMSTAEWAPQWWNDLSSNDVRGQTAITMFRRSVRITESYPRVFVDNDTNTNFCSTSDYFLRDKGVTINANMSPNGEYGATMNMEVLRPFSTTTYIQSKELRSARPRVYLPFYDSMGSIHNVVVYPDFDEDVGSITLPTYSGVLYLANPVFSPMPIYLNKHIGVNNLILSQLTGVANQNEGEFISAPGDYYCREVENDIAVSQNSLNGNDYFSVPNNYYMPLESLVTQTTMVCDMYLSIETNAPLVFSAGMFPAGLSKIRIMSLPDSGTLNYDGAAVTINQEITAANLGLLVYTPTLNSYDRVMFNYQYMLNTVGATYSPQWRIRIAVNYGVNGNIENQTLLNTPLEYSKADFTAVLGSLYSIVIERLPGGYGTLQLSGEPVSVGQEILYDDLDNLVFTPPVGYVSVRGIWEYRVRVTERATLTPPYYIRTAVIPSLTIGNSFGDVARLNDDTFGFDFAMCRAVDKLTWLPTVVMASEYGLSLVRMATDNDPRSVTQIENIPWEICPFGAKYIVNFKDIVVIAYLYEYADASGSTRKEYPSSLAWSNVGDFRDWRTYDSDTEETDSMAGIQGLWSTPDEITGLAVLQDRLYVFSPNSIHEAYFTGSVEMPFAFTEARIKFGGYCPIAIGNFIYFWNYNEGFCSFDGASIHKISEIIKEEMLPAVKTDFQDLQIFKYDDSSVAVTTKNIDFAWVFNNSGWTKIDKNGYTRTVPVYHSEAFEFWGYNDTSSRYISLSNDDVRVSGVDVVTDIDDRVIPAASIQPFRSEIEFKIDLGNKRGLNFLRECSIYGLQAGQCDVSNRDGDIIRFAGRTQFGTDGNRNITFVPVSTGREITVRLIWQNVGIITGGLLVSGVPVDFDLDSPDALYRLYRSNHHIKVLLIDADSVGQHDRR